MAGFSARAGESVDLRVVPYPAVTVAIDLGDGLVVVEDDGGRQHRGSVAAGLAPGSVRAVGRDVECLQVRLSPVVAYDLLGASSELSGTIASLDDLWGSDSTRIVERLRDTASWEDRFAIVEAVLTRRLEAGGGVDPEVALAWQRMVTTRGRLRVDHLADETGWSRKRLWSRFRSQVGVTPKRASQLIRFDHAAHRLAAGHSAAVVAAESGYADQSHLHREAASFAGLTPRAIASAPWLAVDDFAWSQ